MEPIIAHLKHIDYHMFKSKVLDKAKKNYKPTLKWLKSASLDDIKNLGALSFHIKDDILLSIDSHFQYLFWLIEVSLDFVCEELDIYFQDGK